jgi:hypothetical protein
MSREVSDFKEYCLQWIDDCFSRDADFLKAFAAVPGSSLREIAPHPGPFFWPLLKGIVANDVVGSDLVRTPR